MKIVAPANLVVITHVQILVYSIHVDRMQRVLYPITARSVRALKEWLRAQRPRLAAFVHRLHIVPKTVDAQKVGHASRNTAARFVLPI